MKKLLAILLVLTMVLPLCLVANAADSNVEIRPFYMSNNLNEFDNIIPKVHLWSDDTAKYVTENSIVVSAVGLGAKTPKDIAAKLKPIFDEYPEGYRFIRFSSFRAALLTLKEDEIFMEKGAKLIKQWVTEFVKEYSAIGGKLDGFSVDFEYVDANVYGLTKTALTDVYVYDRIVSNPNYAKKIRPALEERGFKFWPNPTDETPEIYSINQKSGEEYAQSRNIWNVVLRNHYNQYVTEAVYEPAKAYFPDIVVYDYQARTTHAWQKTPDKNGDISAGGNYVTAGNMNYYNAYGYNPATDFFLENGVNPYKKIPSYNNVEWQNNAFRMTLWDSVISKNYYETAPDGNFVATVAYYNYADNEHSKREGTYSNTPYYTEDFYHLGMLNPTLFNGYIEESEVIRAGNDITETMEVVHKILNELTRIVGAADRKPLDLPYSWNDAFILSGMYAGGKNYYRLTPDITGGMKLEDFQVKDAKDLTFTHQGQTITFPGGKIIKDSKIPIVGSCGFWIETAQDVLPVITYSANRYSEYPALMESFETYEKGADFDITTAAPVGCWELKKDKTGTAKIAEESGNKGLALTGTYSLRLKDILKNVTAGDTYAKNQAWEIEVTVPGDMAADAEIILLDVYGSKSKAAEGGFKIAGGKVYYDKSGEYVELSGVNVSKGGKFRFVRGMDFNKEDAITSDYTVYDASGKLLGEVKDIPSVTMKLPVERIGLSVSKVAGSAVVLDNLKLYSNGVGADFELYDAKTGIEYTDLETAKKTDTAYRFSWMNATAYEKVYSIVAVYNNGEEKVVETIKMAPGTDAVATGIVKLEDGQTVRLYARNDSKDAPEDNKPGANNGNSGDMTLIIVLIAGVVVLVALIVVAVLIVFKKPAATEEKKEETEDKTEE